MLHLIRFLYEVQQPFFSRGSATIFFLMGKCNSCEVQQLFYEEVQQFFSFFSSYSLRRILYPAQIIFCDIFTINLLGSSSFFYIFFNV
jgi:hypothetical protein